jgi:signal transduction histidine kinase/ActR/RegA family two-component response regulator
MLGSLVLWMHRQRLRRARVRIDRLASVNAALEAEMAERRRAETERARIEGQLRHAQKMDAFGQLAGGVCHDFNNILTVIRGFAEICQQESREQGGNGEAADQVLDATERAARLTRQLLAFNRHQPLRPDAVDPNSLVRGLESMLTRLIGAHIRLELELGREVGRVLVDPGQLEQVITNLVLNARDSMEDGGTVTLRTDAIELDEQAVAGEVRPGRFVRIDVQDTGGGVPEALYRKIFEPFFTTKEVGKGTGLGLSTAYGIVRQSGGMMRLWSQEGVGSTFQVLLPVTDLPTQVEQERPASDSGTLPIEPRVVLVVEDEVHVRQLLRSSLAREGFRVLDAADGQQALEILASGEEQIDLVMTDLVMPRLGGAELLRRVRADHPHLPFIFISGYPDRGADPYLGTDERTRFLQKPFRLDELREALAKALRPAPANAGGEE